VEDFGVDDFESDESDSWESPDFSDSVDESDVEPESEPESESESEPEPDVDEPVPSVASFSEEEPPEVVAESADEDDPDIEHAANPTNSAMALRATTAKRELFRAIPINSSFCRRQLRDFPAPYSLFWPSRGQPTDVEGFFVWCQEYETEYGVCVETRHFLSNLHKWVAACQRATLTSHSTAVPPTTGYGRLCAMPGHEFFHNLW
jgi:hypothetical protein